MKKIQATAKTIQKAIEEGLKQLNVSQEEVDIKILDEGGLFRKAKVELLYDDGKPEEETPAEEIKAEKKEDKKAEKKDKKAEKELKKADKKDDKKEEKKEVKEVEKKESKNETSITDFGTKFLSELCANMDVCGEVSFVKTENGVTFNISGEKVSPLIGKRGETLNAIQEILSNACKKAGFREERVYFDVENYKNRREISLVNLGERMAKKALKIEKPIRLERMNAYERKIIHTALQNMEGITTRSEGEEPNRYIVIVPNVDVKTEE